ncbi:hypothetical protein, partial [Enterobacter hormaechei]
FSKGYFGFDISGTIPFHRPTKWVQYTISFLMWDSPLFASCESLRQTASSTRHALYAPSLRLSENRFIS